MFTDDSGKSMLAICGQGINFYFDRKKKSPVLKDLNIEVTPGVIYSLLGPNGCGKTTLLKCILGQHKLQKGSLKIYGKTPGSKGISVPGRGVGYMPQELGLYQEMSAEETLKYFGSLHHVNKRDINERISFLFELLGLPDKKRQIKYLSGGEQRRVSFAAALVHKAPLLILDEPTVSVDPLVRQSIWNHLRALAHKERRTIIITTHYIEEARQAHLVGLMRDGHMLAERNPEDLIKEYGAATLGEVFVRLCENHSKEDRDLGKSSDALTCVACRNPKFSTENNETVWLPRKGSGTLAKAKKANCLYEVHGYKCNVTLDEERNSGSDATALSSPVFFPRESGYRDSTFSESWNRLSCLTCKNLLYFRRNTLWMILQLLIPAIVIAVFCLAVGGDPYDLPVAVANMGEEPSEFGRIFLRFINNRTIHQNQFDNLSLAVESVKKGESWVAIHVGPEFTTCLIERILKGIDVTNDTIECSIMKLYPDMSNPIIFQTIYSNLMRSFRAFSAHLLEEHGKNPSSVSPPLKLEDPPIYGSASTTFTEYFIPGQMLGFGFCMAIALTALSVVQEKNQGLLERTFVAGATTAEMFLSLFAAFLVSVLGQTTFILLCAFVVFNIPCNGSVLWVVICVLLCGTSGMSLGLLISSIFVDEFATCMFAIGAGSINLLLCGFFWPFEALPYYLRYFSYCLPLTLISQSLRSIITRGWNITDHHVWDGCLVSIAWTVLSVVLCMLIFKIKK